MTEVDTRKAPSAPGPLAAFARFVLCGGGVGVASSAGVSWLAGLMPWVVANALITVVSTLLCTELHALFTFGTGGPAGWRRHLQSAGSATAAYLVTSAAVLLLEVVRPTAGALYEQAVYLGAAGLAGLGRFLVLRLCVFAVATGPTVPVKGTAGTMPVAVRDSAHCRTVRHPSANLAGVRTARPQRLRPLARAHGGTVRPGRHPVGRPRHVRWPSAATGGSTRGSTAPSRSAPGGRTASGGSGHTTHHRPAGSAPAAS
jgi:hypothetical protein